MIPARKREILTVFVTVTMIFVAGSAMICPYQVQSISSLNPMLSFEIDPLNDPLTRENNSTTEDFEDGLNEKAWSKYSSDKENGTNMRSDHDAYTGSTYSWRMDTDVNGANLNELVLHIGLKDVIYLTMKFATLEFGVGNRDLMPAAFEDHSNSDGIAVSNDGFSWYRLWQYPDDVSGWTEFEVNITAVPNMEFDPQEDLYLKFQQYGSGSIPNDGILWDSISLEANPHGEFNFEVPQLNVNFNYDPNPFTIYAETQGDPDEAFVTVTIEGTAGSGGNGDSRAEPVVYNFSNCGATIYDSPTQSLGNSVYSNSNKKYTLTQTGDVQVLGDGDPAGEEVRFTYEKADGLVVNGDPDIDEITWSSAEDNPVDDAVFVGDEFEIELSLSSPDGFYGSIGSITVSYYSWDGDEVELQLEVPNLRIHAFANATLEGDVIAHNGYKQNDPGSLLTLNSFNGQDPPGIMPAQAFINWRATDLGDYVEFVNVIDNDTDQPYPHKKIIRVTGGNPGDTGTVFVTHKASGEEDEYPVTLVSGPVFQGIIYSQETYVAGETGVITVALEDNYGNAAMDWRDRMYVNVTQGQVDFVDEFEQDEKGHYYMYTSQDKGVHSFIITPYTFHGVGPTTIEFSTVSVPIGEPASLNVVAGPVKSLHVEYDPANMPGWDNSYYAGDDLYFTVYGTDEMGNPSTTYNAPIIVTHDFNTNNKDLVPEPWQSSDGSVMLNMVDGVASNYPDHPIKLFGAGEVNIIFRSKIDLEGIKAGSKIVTVNPTYLDHLEALPGGPITAPVTVDVKVGATQHFSVKGYDEFYNPIEIENATWRVDSNIKAYGTLDILVDGEFRAIEYFGLDDDGVFYDPDLEYSTREGTIDVTAVCPRDGREVIQVISIRVLNDKDVWLEEEQVEPDQILMGTDMELQANIYYDMPVIDPGTMDQKSSLGNLFELNVIVTLVDNSGKKLVELVNKPVRLMDLDTNPEGTEIFNVIVPWEKFGDHMKRWEAGNPDTKNFMKIEIIDVPGGTDMSDFEKSADNNLIILDLYGVDLPGYAPNEDYLTGIDGDGDGMDDGWENHYFSGDSIPGDDPDGDGLTNLEEFKDGTNPLERDDLDDNHDDEGFMDSGFARILLISVGVLLLLIILVILLVFIFKKKPGPGIEEKEVPDAHGRINPEIYGLNTGKENEHRVMENRQDEPLGWDTARTTEKSLGERHFPPPPDY